MHDYFASGHAADVVLAVMLAEAVYLVAVRRRPFGSVVLALLPGALILLGLRAALTGAAWYWVALPLAASLPPHLFDLKRRGWW